VPRSEFARRIEVATDPATAWSVLTDVQRLVGWVSVLEDATEIEHLSRYGAVLMDRVGPFRLRADLDIVLTDVREGEHVSVHAEGEDRQVGSRLVVDATLDLERLPVGGVVAIAGSYEVTGKVASMGAGTIRKKADRILDDFFASLTTTLGTP
jgi:carbon monoxide dehydrogenase subunit G